MSPTSPHRVTRWALGLTVAVAALAFSQSAFAAFSSSQITSPGDNSFVQYTPQTPNTLHVAGSTDGPATSNADLVCFWGNYRTVLAQNVQVVDGGFSVDVPLNQFTQSSPLPYCVLRAVPVGDATNYPPGAPSPFAGTRIGAGRFETYDTDGRLRDFRLQQAQSQASLDYYSAGSCGLANSYMIDPVTLARSYSLFYCNGWLWSRNGSTSAGPTQEQATSSEIRVDGANAYLANSASNLYYVDATHQASKLDGRPELSIAKSIDPANGNVHISEASGLVRCAPNATAFHASHTAAAWATDCTSFAGVGVKLERTVDSDRNGRRTTMTDVWSSTDGQSHQLELQYDEEFAGYSGDVSPIIWFSWAEGAKGVTAVAGQTMPGPAGGAPATVFLDSNGQSNNIFDYPQGAVTYAPGPDDVHWSYADGQYASGLWRYTRTVPAGGSMKIVHIYENDPSYEVLADNAAADRDKVVAPRITISHPADGAMVASPAVTVTGTTSDPGGGRGSVTVNGQAADVAADGTWSKSITLAEGDNVITAVASDGAGNSSEATVKVTFAPATPTAGTPGTTSGAGAGSAVDKAAPVLGLSTTSVKLATLLKKGLPVKATCSEACSFKLALTIDARTAKRLGLAARVFTIGAKSSAIAAPGSKKLTVKLGRKAIRKLARLKSVRVKVTLSAADAAQNVAKKSVVATIRRGG